MALWIASFCIPIVSYCLIHTQRLYTNMHTLQDEIAIAQLRRILIPADQFIVNASELHFRYHDQEWSVYQSGKNLIMTPGTQYLLTNIEQSSFSVIDHHLYLSYVKEAQPYEVLLCTLP